MKKFLIYYVGLKLCEWYHFFFLPAPPWVLSFFTVSLVTPTATVCFISLTANLPRGGNSANCSTTIGLDGTILTMAASPDWMCFGNSSVTLPVLLSIFDSISWNLQAMWQVWQSRTGAYPFWILPGWFMTITWARKFSVSAAGVFLASEATYPLLISVTERPLTLKPTLSPGIASATCS